MVLVETNYGSSGAGIGSSSPSVRYTSTTSCHQYWNKDQSAPTTNGTVSNYRPNIIITSECPYFTGSSTSYYITKFTTTGALVNVSNTTTGTGQAHSDYYSSQSITASPGTTINTNVEMSSSGTYGVAIWVDWNNNGVFETSEKVYGTTSYTSTPIAGSFTVPSGQASGSYRVRVMGDYYGGGAPNDPCVCNTGEVEDYKIIVPPCPTNRTLSVSASPTTICSGESVTYTATPSSGYSPSTYKWYGASSSGGSYTLLSTTTSNTYTRATTSSYRFVKCTSSVGASCEATSNIVTITVNPIPSLPTTTSNSRCGSGSITLSASPGSNGTTCRWYAASTGGSVLHTGTSYSPTLSSTTTYYVSTFNATTGCESTSRQAVTATIFPTNITITPSSSAMTVGNSYTLSASAQLIINGQIIMEIHLAEVQLQ